VQLLLASVHAYRLGLYRPKLYFVMKIEDSTTERRKKKKSSKFKVTITTLKADKE